MRHSLGTFTTDGRKIFHRITGVEISKPAFIYDINSGHTIYVGDVLDCYKRMAYSRLYYPYTEIYEFENIITRSLSKSLDVLCRVMNSFLSLNDNQPPELFKTNPHDIEHILERHMQE